MECWILVAFVYRLKDMLNMFSSMMLSCTDVEGCYSCDAAWCQWLSSLICRKFFRAPDTQYSFTYRQPWIKTCTKEANCKEGSAVTWAVVWTRTCIFSIKWLLFKMTAFQFDEMMVHTWSLPLKAEIRCAIEQFTYLCQEVVPLKNKTRYTKWAFKWHKNNQNLQN